MPEPSQTSQPSLPAPANAEREPIGQISVRQYGKYYLVKKLAEGGMAEIFLAKQVGVENFEKNVVVKRMLSHLSSVQDFVSMFLDEARLAATLAHPNVVQILDLGFEQGCYFIAMEYLAGEDFSTVVRAAAKQRKYVPINVVLKIMADAANGLHFAHEVTDTKGQRLNIVHRDVSPSNIFVTYTGQVKVLDFGIAKAESRITNTTAGVVKGKYQYMSPEQASSGDVDARSDVYSMGVCLYEALTNTRPFARESDLAILNAVLKNEYKPLREVRPDLPAEIEQIVTKALAPNAADRYQSGAALAADLESYLRATTSVTSGTALAQYMTTFFGHDRVIAKTRIDTLKELTGKPGFAMEMGRTVSGPGMPLVTPTDVNKAEELTRNVGLPTSVKNEKRKRRGFVAAVVLATLVVGIGGTLLATKFVPGSNGGQPIPPVAGGAGGAGGGVAAVTEDAGVDAGADAGVDAGAPDVLDAGAPAVPDAGPEKKQCTTLSLKGIGAVISANSRSIAKCFNEHRSELPAENGRIVVTFGVGLNGRVSTVETDVSDKPVGKCVESRMKAIAFPRLCAPIESVQLPLGYSTKL